MAIFVALVSIFIFTSAEEPRGAPPSSEQSPPALAIAEIANPGGSRATPRA
jgi:hypothetical protein